MNERKNNYNPKFPKTCITLLRIIEFLNIFSLVKTIKYDLKRVYSISRAGHEPNKSYL